MIDRDLVLAVARDFGVAPTEVESAIALIRTGRAELVTAVINKRLTVPQALQIARKHRSECP
jgi:hypothetical protein